MHGIPAAWNRDGVDGAGLQASSLETRCLRFLLGAGHVGRLCLKCAEIPGSRKESRCWALAAWSVEPRYHESPLSIRQWRECSRNPLPQTPQARPCKQAFLSYIAPTRCVDSSPCRHILRIGIARFSGNTTFNFFYSPSGCSVFILHWLFIQVPIAPHPGQHLLLAIFLSITILAGLIGF